MALGDFTKIGVKPGDEGGELDPHGATGLGNPVGGNVTSNVTGSDAFHQQWMNYISYNMVCVRLCIAGSDIAPTPLECQHTLDAMGCEWVMPGDFSDKSFDTCEGDAAYPPSLYPEGDGQTSTFQQYYSSVYTAPNGGVQTWVNGSPTEITPQAAYSLSDTSSCSTKSTISNGIKEILPSNSISSSSGAATMTITPSKMTTTTTTSSSTSTNTNSIIQNASNTKTDSAISTYTLSTLMIGTFVAFIVGSVAFLV